MAATDQYVLYGGEFTTVNGVDQQGLSRFAVSALAPNKQGPVVSGKSFGPSVAWTGSGAATESWTANWDRDNTHLTYDVFRDGSAIPIYSTAADSTFWNRPTLSFTDTGLPPGTSHTYTLQATDPFGNTAIGAATTLAP